MGGWVRYSYSYFYVYVYIYVLTDVFFVSDQYFVGYAPQPTRWSEMGLRANASLTFDGGVSYTRSEEWWFPVTSMTVSG